MVKQERVGRHLRREKRCKNGFKAARTDKVGRRVISRKRIRVHLHRNGKFSFFEKVRKWNLLKTEWAGGTSFKAISSTNRIESGKHFEMFEVCINRWPTKDAGRRVSSEQHSPEAAGLTLTRAPSSATRRSPSILRTNAHSHRLGLKRLQTERPPSYRTVCSIIESKLKLIKLRRLKENASRGHKGRPNKNSQKFNETFKLNEIFSKNSQMRANFNEKIFIFKFCF